ncbi:MAG: XRE family transcriptional regulator [Pseudomonadota bacterium]
MDNASPDIATVQALRSDVALQLARFTQRMGVTQVVAARRLGLPQPTLSKILNGRVSDVSLELLIRTAARAGLSMTLQTGRVPQEAGAFVSGTHSSPSRSSRSKLGDEARESLNQSASRLTPTERLQAFLEHNQLLGALHQAGRTAEVQRQRNALQKL